MKDARIAILGGGMLGTCTALELARRGCRSTLFEGRQTLLQAASRWNEGKIHLGFLYAGDPTLRTAQRLIPGGLAFAGLVGRLIQRTLDAFITAEDDIYLVHRESVAGPEAFNRVLDEVAATVFRQVGCSPEIVADLLNGLNAAVVPGADHGAGFDVHFRAHAGTFEVIVYARDREIWRASRQIP